MTVSESMVDLESLSQPSVMQLAQKGNCQAIAHWLNAYLMSQGVHSRVTLDRPGCLLIIVEFHRLPDRDRLIRFVCHRLHKLNTNAFAAVRIVARFIGTAFVLWDQTVRLTAQPKRQHRILNQVPAQTRSQRIGAIAATPAARPKTPAPAPSRTPAPVKLQRSVNVARPAKIERRPAYLLPASPSASWRLPPSTKLKHPVLLGSALAAFLVGSGYETFTDFSFTAWLEQAQFQAFGQMTAGSSPLRPSKVQTALGLVTVKQQAIAHNPNDPTVTLTFSNDFVLEPGAIVATEPVSDGFNSNRSRSTPSESDPFPADSSSSDLSSADAVSSNTIGSARSHSASPATEQSRTESSNGTNYSLATATTNPYTQADIALANLDAPLTHQANTRSATGSTHASVEQLVDHGVDVVNLASSQIVEHGKTGLTQTLHELETAGIESIGAGHNRREARQPEIIDVRGQRIAYLGYSDSQSGAAKPWSAGVNAAIDKQVIDDIKAIRDQVDWVIVNYRWSGALADYPADWQVRLAHLAIDQGADLVVGHHPDVLQGAEIYKGRAIAYSLGDFVFGDSQTSKTNYNTAMLKVSIRDRQMQVEFLPVQVRDSKPELVDAERGKTILRYLQQASGLFEQPMQSPMVLNTGSSDVSEPNASPRVPPPLVLPTSSETAPAPENAADTDASDSFVTYPDQQPDAAPDTSITDTLEENGTDEPEQMAPAPAALDEPAALDPEETVPEEASDDQAMGATSSDQMAIAKATLHPAESVKLKPHL